MVLYIIEHLEEGELSEWCRLEYIEMLKSVDLPDLVVFTNVTAETSIKLLSKPNSRVFSNPLESFLSRDFLTFPCLEPVTFKQTCLLDMKADHCLSPSDYFQAVVFGGILGNVHILEDGSFSSDDKTSIVRKLGLTENRRHLGELQMTTDTALMVTYRILREGSSMEDLKFVDHPEIGDAKDVTIMEGFRYLTDEKGDIVLPDGMAQHLSQAMDFDLTDEL